MHRELRMSVLYVTHDQDEALTLSDRIAVFRRGRLAGVLNAAEASQERLMQLAS